MNLQLCFAAARFCLKRSAIPDNESPASSFQNALKSKGSHDAAGVGTADSKHGSKLLMCQRNNVIITTIEESQNPFRAALLNGMSRIARCSLNGLNEKTMAVSRKNIGKSSRFV
jgi:hypothetical protein